MTKIQQYINLIHISPNKIYYGIIERYYSLQKTILILECRYCTEDEWVVIMANSQYVRTSIWTHRLWYTPYSVILEHPIKLFLCNIHTINIHWLHTVSYTVYTIQCTVYSISYKLYIIQYILYTIQCKLYNDCTVYNVQCKVYNTLCSTCIIIVIINIDDDNCFYRVWKIVRWKWLLKRKKRGDVSRRLRVLENYYKWTE